MATYIFSNCRKSSDSDFDTHIRQLGITEKDNLVFLNKCIPLYGRTIFNGHPNCYAVLRAFFTLNAVGFFGQEAMLGKTHKFKQIFLFNHHKDTILIQKAEKDKDVCNVPVSNTWLTEYIEKTKKIPTTGFAAYFLVQDLLGVAPETIRLVNFYGSADNSTPKCDEHAWAYEEEVIQHCMHRVYA